MTTPLACAYLASQCDSERLRDGVLCVAMPPVVGPWSLQRLVNVWIHPEAFTLLFSSLKSPVDLSHLTDMLLDYVDRVRCHECVNVAASQIRRFVAVPVSTSSTVQGRICVKVVVAVWTNTIYIQRWVLYVKRLSSVLCKCFILCDDYIRFILLINFVIFTNFRTIRFEHNILCKCTILASIQILL